MTTAKTAANIDAQKLDSFRGKVFADIAAAAGFACAYIGDRLGLYKAMAKLDSVSSSELASATDTNERYVREWLLNQAAGGYVLYDPASKKYSLPPEHALALADENSPFFAAGGLQSFMALMQAAPKMVQKFKDGSGLSWSEQNSDLFEGTERFFKPAYISQLVSQWIPSIPGLQQKLEKGCTLADVGCGRGISTLVMARAFPNSKFYGFDNHQPSIEAANANAQAEGLESRVKFEVAAAQSLPDHQYDVIAFFDCLHDMGDPVSACKQAKAVLSDDGCLMIVEPMAGNHPEENFNEIGRAYSGASVLCCTPNAVASGGTALGTIATDDALRQVLTEAGFSNFERVLSTPFNRIFEARV
jgi:2-polyprenyl-3-methyl-5-hydroxy-6-metoxy-1,4-benzoquinol methylase